MMRWILALTLLLALPAKAEDSSMPATETYRAITSQSIWLNTSRPLKAEDLQGRILLLDFWTLGCINCMDIIPDLKYLEQTFGDKLTVIGVHSAKFANEKDTENIRNAILRYGLVHPVTNDADFTIWNKFGVRAWPTLVLINPLGTASQVYEGEGHRAALEADINALLQKYSGSVVTAPLPIALESSRKPQTALSFPGKIIAQDEGRLIIADSGHNRIVVADTKGAILQVIGSGQPGLKDGSLAEAQFFKPQGMAYKDGRLYVADLGNHALRLVDFNDQTVTTLAGTGGQGYVLQAGHENDALKVALSSPWDVAFYPDYKHLAIAAAGTQQILSYDIAHATISVLAGNGHESIDDGHLPEQSLAQPSGLFASGDKLYFTDAESSSLRVLDKDGAVNTLVGHGLFDFGYKEGGRDEALLQHCLGLTGDAGTLYLADTYNHSVRRYDIREGRLYNYAGHDQRGKADGALARASFNEPGGIARIGQTLYVADTNNNLVRTIDMKAGTVGTLAVAPDAAATATKAPTLPALPNLQSLAFKVAKGTPVEVTLALKEGWHINHDAPSELGLYVDPASGKPMAKFDKDALAKGPITLPALTYDTPLHLWGVLYYCADAKGSLCMIKGFDAKITPDGTESKIVLPVN